MTRVVALERPPGFLPDQDSDLIVFQKAAEMSRRGKAPAVDKSEQAPVKGQVGPGDRFSQDFILPVFLGEIWNGLIFKVGQQMGCRPRRPAVIASQVEDEVLDTTPTDLSEGPVNKGFEAFQVLLLVVIQVPYGQNSR